MNSRTYRLLILFWASVVFGCDAPPPVEPDVPEEADTSTASLPREAQPVGDKPVEKTSTTDKRAARDSAAAVTRKGRTETQPEQKGPPSREVARPGVGKKGRGYGGGLISEPARHYFGLRERLVFQIQIPQAMQTYKALNGRGPKDQGEFMKKIVSENQIKLPELPAGASYVYDPESGELMVERNVR